MIKTNGRITPDIDNENTPNPNPKNSPFIVNYAVIVFKYPKIMKSINPSIDIESIVLKNT